VRREVWPYGGRRYDQQLWAVLASEWRTTADRASAPRNRPA
jgi:hypothetical protein